MTTFDELLVECVRANPHLYSKENPDFMNATKRKFTWSAIAESVQSNAEYCEKRWRSLRDQFSREHRRRNSYIPSGSGSAVVVKKEWEFYHTMSFLAEHIRHKPSQSSFVAPPSTISLESSPGPSHNNNFRQPINPSTSNQPAIVNVPFPTQCASPGPSSSATSDVTTDVEDYNVESLEITFENEKLSNPSSYSTTPSSSSSKKRKTLLSPPPDFSYRKKSDQVDAVVTNINATLAAAMNSFSSVVEKTKAAGDKADDGTEAILNCLKNRLKNVPEESRTDCLIEMLQVISKHEKKIAS